MVEIYKNLKQNKMLLLMVLPTTIWFLLFKYLPMFGLVIAFKDFDMRKGILSSDWIGLRNFEFLFRTSDAFVITRNTILYNFSFIFIGTVFYIMLAIILNELGNSLLNKVNRAFLIFPHFLSWVIVGYFSFAFLNADKGLINGILKLFNIEEINWYAEQKYWPIILFMCHIWKHMGYNSIVYFATIRGFSVEYYEAAKIDGANLRQQIYYITLPLLKPITTIMVLLAVGRIFYSDFGLFFMIPRNTGLLYPVTNVIDTYVYNGMISSGDFGMIGAAGFYQSIVGFLLVLLSNYVVKKLNPENSLF